MNIKKLLERNVPHAIYRRTSQTIMILSMAAFALVFMLIFQPFDIYKFADVQKIYLFYGWDITHQQAFYVACVTIVAAAMVIVAISRTIMYLYTSLRGSIRYQNYLWWNLLEFVILSLMITGLSAAVFHVEDLISIFLRVLWQTTCILLMPYGYSLLYIIIVDNVSALTSLREKIAEDDATLQKAYIHFNDDKGLRLSVRRDDLLLVESADNYVCVWYLNNGKVRKSMIRNTMKRVAEELHDSNIRRCHRSYMVNMDRVNVMRREKEGIFIELGLDGVPDIPISKTYAESITSWLIK